MHTKTILYLGALGLLGFALYIRGKGGVAGQPGDITVPMNSTNATWKSGFTTQAGFTNFVPNGELFDYLQGKTGAASGYLN